MRPALECRYYYDPAAHAGPPAGSEPVDATAPAAAEELSLLGISPADLPAMTFSEPDGRLRVVGLRLAPEEAERLASGTGFGTTERVVFSSSWCPNCRLAKRLLEEIEASFAEVDIDENPRAEATILERSGGRRVVPTMLFGDRLWAFNPDPPLLRRLASGVVKP